MRLRTLWIWKKGKPLWLLLIGWLVFGALFLLLLGYNLFDWRGGLPKVAVADSETISADGVQAVELHAEGVTVEVASSYDIREIKVQLYGSGYVNQHAVWQQDEKGRLVIKLAQYPVTANAYGNRYEDNLTMRVLLPKRSYDELAAYGDRLHVAFYQCKSKQLIADVAYGSIDLYRADLQKAELLSNTSKIKVNRSRIHHLDIENRDGDTNLLDNELRYWRYHSKSGDLEALTSKIKGIWELSSEWGDIHVGTKKWTDNLLLDLHTGSGVLTASSKKKPWKKTIPTALTEQDLLLLEGRGENILSYSYSSQSITQQTSPYPT